MEYGLHCLGGSHFAAEPSFEQLEIKFLAGKL
jgi:hypothetical protein